MLGPLSSEVKAYCCCTLFLGAAASDALARFGRQLTAPVAVFGGFPLAQHKATTRRLANVLVVLQLLTVFGFFFSQNPQNTEDPWGEARDPLCCTFLKSATKWVLQVPNDPGLLPYLVVRFFLEIFHDPSQARINIAPETLSA